MFPGLYTGIDYYFAVTATDTAANESGYSDEVVFKYDSLIECRKFDIQCDHRIDLLDMIEFDKSFGSIGGSELYNLRFDYDENERIDFLDLVEFDKAFGTIYGE